VKAELFKDAKRTIILYEGVDTRHPSRA